MTKIIAIGDELYLYKGGPGSGRYPAGSGGGSKGGKGGGGFARLSAKNLKEMSKTADALNDKQKYALGLYAGGLDQNDPDAEFIEEVDESNHDLINPALRSRKGLDNLNAEERKQVALMDKAIATSTVPADTTVYRGAVDKGLEEGDAFCDKAFTSTSIDESTAEEFAEGVRSATRENPTGVPSCIYAIEVPKDAQGLYLDDLTGSSEGEILLPRNSWFQVTEANTSVSPAMYTVRLIPRMKGEMP